MSKEMVLIIVIVIILLIYLISKRNSFVLLRNAVDEQMSNISNYREQRTTYLEDALGIATMEKTRQPLLINLLS